MIKVVHYINQFYAGKGGEEMANIPPEKVKGFVGPGMAFNAAFKGEAEIVATVFCGDSYFNENKEAIDTVIAMIKEEQPDIVICGPAFNAGRYGVACGTVASEVKAQLGIPTLTGMYDENPGVDMFKSKTIIMKTKDSAAGMRKAVAAMAPVALRMAKGEELGSAAAEGYFPTGIRKGLFEEKRGSARAVDMLLKKLAGEEFETEYPMPQFDRVQPNPAVVDLAHAKVALVTSGGIVPKGNPDHIESSSASHYGKYDIEGVQALTDKTYETAHGGYDPVYANADPNRVLPVDVMREFEKEGRIGELSHYYYATVGNGTAVASAKKF
ncbi:MAG: glycine/betaine/sarcosine/D-proline family reductase selenoprotein B, partial [Firmicutes bacterium]|nr:glycine/betaine/sarcosine/D-proline family reductase selenoprotein B [Bacillota bacterium]